MYIWYTVLSQGSILFILLQILLDVHVYVLLYILYVLCSIVYFMSCTTDKSAMTSIKTYILTSVIMQLIQTWMRSNETV